MLDRPGFKEKDLLVEPVEQSARALMDPPEGDIPHLI